MSGWQPSARVGMVGAGQLARMTQQAAIGLGVELRLLARGDTDAAAAVSATFDCGSPDSLADLRRLAASCDVVTFDHELVPNDHLVQLEAEGVDVQPPARAKLAAQDKLHARDLLGGAGFPVPQFAPVDSLDDVAAFGERVGWPLVLKRRSGGYDGRGVRIVADRSEAGSIELDDGGWLAEELVPIDLEVAQLVVRSRTGEIAAYPLVHTVQEDGICVETVVPAGVAPTVASRCREIASGIAETIGAVGIVAVELFVDAESEVTINELALRPHNSGHWTIEGSETSQFENHLRAVLGWPLGSVAPTAGAAAMRNLIGRDEENLSDRVGVALGVPGAHLHLYGKDPAPGRKLGHVTALGDEPETARRRCLEVVAIMQPE